MNIDPQRYEQMILKAQARMEGREAAKNHEKCDANPYSEELELHWQWLNAWCEQEMEMRGVKP